MRLLQGWTVDGKGILSLEEEQTILLCLSVSVFADVGSERRGSRPAGAWWGCRARAAKGKRC